MNSSKTKKIELEIYEDKEADFYLSLLEYKNNSKPNSELAKKICDSIKFDLSEIEKEVKATDLRKDKIENVLLKLYNFLVQSGKHSPYYITIANSNKEEFLQSGFAIELTAVLDILELSKTIKGKETSPEIKAMLYFSAQIFSEASNILQEAFGNTVSQKEAASLLWAQLMQSPQKISVNERGNQVYHFPDSAEIIETEIYLERNGKLKKAPAEMLKGIEMNIKGFENFSSFYMKVKDTAWHFTPVGDNIEIRVLHNIEIKNSRINLQNSKTDQFYVAPLQEFNSFRVEDNSGSYTVQKTTPMINSITNQIQLGSKYKKLSQSSVRKAKHEKLTNKNTSTKYDDIVSFFYSPLDKIISTLLKLHDNSIKKIESRDKIILAVYGILKKHFPDSTTHVRNTIAGFVCAQIGWLDSEEKHDESKRHSSYRKYLIDTISKTLKKHKIT